MVEAACLRRDGGNRDKTGAFRWDRGSFWNGSPRWDIRSPFGWCEVVWGHYWWVIPISVLVHRKSKWWQFISLRSEDGTKFAWRLEVFDSDVTSNAIIIKSENGSLETFHHSPFPPFEMMPSQWDVITSNDLLRRPELVTKHASSIPLLDLQPQAHKIHHK